MLVTRITLDSSKIADVTNYADAVLEIPNKYIISTNTTSTTLAPEGLDKNDPTLPVLSDDFILNHNLNEIDWKKGFTLHRGIFSQFNDIAYPPLPIVLSLVNVISDAIGKQFVKPRGSFLYPKDGYMGWHTNSDVPGIRVYAAYSQVQQGSYFKYVDRWSSPTPTIITDWDDMGWTIRMFTPTENPEDYLWHCVGAIDAPRISFGFLFK